MLRAALLLLVYAWAALAEAPVYVVLWFDTEDYVEPAADDAALRIARDLTAVGVRGTFKVVGEKARTLERRGRTDVIRALSLHDIGYHSEYHSVPPTPAVYLREFGYADGAAEFQRREGQGARDVERIFGITPSCYGQPGSSWGPQANLALRRMGIRVYLDEGEQVGLGEQPFWYGGLLYAFNMGRFGTRASLEAKVPLQASVDAFDRAAAELARRGGGLISIYYHPTEFVTTEFWDGVNFSRGRYTAPGEWKMPHRRTAEDSERCYNLLRRYVEHAVKVPGVRFVTAHDLLQVYGSPQPPKVDAAAVRRHLQAGITFLDTPQGALSASEQLQVLLGLPPRFVEGPSERRASTYRGTTMPRAVFDRAVRDAAAFIEGRRALPPMVWAGSEFLSLADFTATLAGDDGASANVPVRPGALLFEQYFSKDARAAFRWPIHPDGFAPAELLELGRLQGWTLKTAHLR